MTKVAVINNADNSIAIVYFAPEMFDSGSRTRALIPELADKSDDEVIDWIVAKDIPAGTPYSLIDLDTLPSDRYFRNAWIVNNESVTIDLDKAKAIKIEEFRQLRKPLLEALDIEYQRADEEDNITRKQQVVANKQALRDVTTLALPDDLEALKNYMPSILVPGA